jgi:hypothetical protein
VSSRRTLFLKVGGSGTRPYQPERTLYNLWKRQAPSPKKSAYPLIGSLILSVFTTMPTEPAIHATEYFPSGSCGSFVNFG